MELTGLMIALTLLILFGASLLKVTVPPLFCEKERVTTKYHIQVPVSVWDNSAGR